MVSAEWRGARYPGRSPANVLGLGEYFLSKPLRVVSRDSVYYLEPGVTLATGPSLVKPIPFLAFVAWLTWYAGLYLVLLSLKNYRLPSSKY